jgi:excisionase family DNA binding protein
MDERDKNNARAWGQLYALIEKWLPSHSKAWKGLTAPEIDAFCLTPATTVGPVISRAVAAGAIDATVDAEITRIMGEIEPYDGMSGTAAKPMNDEMQGAFWFACYRYVWPDKKALSPVEAAIKLGVTPTRVRAMITDGKLAATKVGGRWTIDPKEVERVLAGREK